MEYFSNFIWEKGSDEACLRISLVLQHAQVRKKSVLLACVCEGGNEGEVGITESGYFSEGLVEWFHRSFLKQCERKLSDEEVEKPLRREVERICSDIGRFTAKKGLEVKLHYWGILLWDNRFWIFCQGDCQGYLVNRRFQKKNLRRLGSAERPETESLHRQVAQEQWLSGKLQHRLGILICTPGLFSNMEKEEVADVLTLGGEVSETRLEKRLQELWKENVRRGESRSVGAIYLHT